MTKGKRMAIKIPEISAMDSPNELKKLDTIKTYLRWAIRCHSQIPTSVMGF